MTQPATTLPPALAALAAAGTAAVSDALDLAGVNGQLWGPQRLSGSGVVVGPAFTVTLEPVAEGERAPAADYLDEVPPGSVVVLAGSKAVCTVWGDILSEIATARGIAGTVVDGLCRDIDRIRELGYSVWAHGAFMRSGKNRVRMTATQQPVVLGRDSEARTVRPGDIVCADGSGVTLVPLARLAEIAETVERIGAMEELVLRDVRAGMALRDARAKHGYNRMALRTADGGDR
ncbi:RraA family protein [Streptomyces sp. NPDC054933]